MEKNNNIQKIIIYLGIFLAGALIMYGVIYTYPQQFSTVITKTEKDVTVTDKGLADAVEKIYDAVVVVSTYKDDALSSSGTGFVYKVTDELAYILTNAHVITGGNKVNVTFTDGKIVETKIVGSNQYEDIAVLSVNKNDIKKIAILGNSEKTRVGDTSFAVGAPLDSAYSWTVTRGIVSGKDRMVEVSLSNTKSADYIMKVLQTDAAINSGNSGGPLCNANGEVIGVTSLKLASTGVEGMGFALPIENAVKTADSVISGDGFDQPYLGVAMLNLTNAYYSNNYYEIIKESKLTSGVIITDIEKNSSADKAGLKNKDIITKIGDTSVSTIAYLRYALYQYKVGEKIQITYYRGAEEKVTIVTLGTSKAVS